MLNKVLKKMKEAEKKAGNDMNTPESKYQDMQINSKAGFHAKKDSSLGAKRARSIGNRNNKRTTK
ncbi:MAG: hypothetical protein HN726_01470 [Candidatus Magasanikbacteria bacterium]|jgi:hypothetical protein|nr:hypothetical protein [Candidatus Magasanikbacteria bacterium]MBT4221295.1 hypothetical protein [Candidatus Magasanikbacteria bacterium]MBT4350441.1 hypothetical protein [Candidatus Magasanikbacteria bacterium]MBT4542012.1 hypothetical protein [Candidatus Magasanikbacteria bacterium]MBT6253419.1 hypothetical protein [Candidatus Magasanikbacteria bacterium]